MCFEKQHWHWSRAWNGSDARLRVCICCVLCPAVMVLFYFFFSWYVFLLVLYQYCRPFLDFSLSDKDVRPPSSVVLMLLKQVLSCHISVQVVQHSSLPPEKALHVLMHIQNLPQCSQSVSKSYCSPGVPGEKRSSERLSEFLTVKCIMRYGIMRKWDIF